jgi:hypothetical protein
MGEVSEGLQADRLVDAQTGFRRLAGFPKRNRKSEKKKKSMKDFTSMEVSDPLDRQQSHRSVPSSEGGDRPATGVVTLFGTS